MADFNNKFLEDHELIREATRLGITTDELKAKKAAADFEPIRTEIPPDGMSDFYQKILSSSQPKPEPIYSPLLKNISTSEPTEEPTRVPQSVPSPVVRNMQPKEIEQKQQFVNSSVDLNKLLNDPEMADALERQKSDMLMATLGRSASNLGHALAQVKPQADYFSGAEKLAKADVEALKEVRKSGYDKFKQGAEIKEITEMDDSNSELSKQFRDTTKSLLNMQGLKDLANKIPENASASFLQKIFPQFSNMINAKMAQEARKDDKALRKEELQQKREEKLAEKNFELETPYGLANTKDDAKKLKEAHEAKSNFDNKLNQMIELRAAKGGGSLLDRESVERGKQLSKDLLLEYKNMAKLGVLSKADEDIINAIIPADPLAFDFIPGQDPIMKRLKSFKDDSDKDFETRVQTRIRGGSPVKIGEQKQVNDEDKAAIDWAKKNSSDPRAKKILKMHGM